MKVVFSQAAGRDVERMVAFLEHLDRSSALRAIDVIRSGAATLGRFADRGVRIESSDIRRFAIPFGSAAYLLDYRVDRERGTVVILRVRHSREAR